jgi:hypothetical protein
VIKTLEAQVGQFLLGCKCPVSRFLPGRAKDLSAPLYETLDKTIYVKGQKHIDECVLEVAAQSIVDLRTRKYDFKVLYLLGELF